MEFIGAGLDPVQGSEVNVVRFALGRPAESPFLRDFEMRLTGTEFKRLVTEILGDVDAYSRELMEEEREFRESTGPQLEALMKAWAGI